MGLLTICKPYCGSWLAPPRPFAVIGAFLASPGGIQMHQWRSGGCKRIVAAALPASTERATVLVTYLQAVEHALRMILFHTGEGVVVEDRRDEEP